MDYVHTPCSGKSCLATRAALVGIMRRKGQIPAPKGAEFRGYYKVIPPIGLSLPWWEVYDHHG